MGDQRDRFGTRRQRNSASANSRKRLVGKSGVIVDRKGLRPRPSCRFACFAHGWLPANEAMLEGPQGSARDTEEKIIGPFSQHFAGDLVLPSCAKVPVSKLLRRFRKWL